MRIYFYLHEGYINGIICGMATNRLKCGSTFFIVKTFKRKSEDDEEFMLVGEFKCIFLDVMMLFELYDA